MASPVSYVLVVAEEYLSIFLVFLIIVMVCAKNYENISTTDLFPLHVSPAEFSNELLLIRFIIIQLKTIFYVQSSMVLFVVALLVLICFRVVRGSILCDRTQPNPSAD